MFTSRGAPMLSAAILACVACGAQAADTVFAAKLDGAHNQPESIKTPATGTVELRFADDGKSVAFRVTVDRLANASTADLHLGSTANIGPVVVKLWPAGSGQKQGEFSGTLAEGSFEAGDLLGPMTGAPLSDLLEELKAGNAYVNVHTNDGAEPPNSGPGDYRLGEIRGQLTAR